jgi:hypothetical protein
VAELAVAKPAVSARARAPRPTVAALRERIGPPEIAFAALLALGAAIVLYETRGLNFFFDDWETILLRRGVSADVLLRPHGPHLSLIPILIYKVWLALFGASSYLPFRVMAALDMVLMGLVLGIACRRWWGPWWGLAPVAVLMTLGSGAISLMWSFEVCYAVADAAGVIALLALSKRSRNGDMVACVALATSLASCSQGIGFALGAAVLIVLRGNWRRSAWVVLIPSVLYGLWYLKYGHATSETHLSLWRGSLVYTLKSLSSTLAGALGVSTPSTSLPPQIDPSFGEPLAFAVIAVFVIAVARGWRPPPIFWAALSVAVSLWIASSLSDATGNRQPTDSRYLATSVMLLSVCVCTGLPRPRLQRSWTIGVVVALAVVCLTNAGQFISVRKEMLTASVDSRAQTGALLLMRGIVPANFIPGQQFGPGLINDVQAGPFFSAVDSFGTTADTPAQILAAGVGPSELADQALANGEEVGLAAAAGSESVATRAPPVLSGAATHKGGCLILGSGPVAIAAPAGKLELKATSRAPIVTAVGRFASAYDISLGQVPRGDTDTVTIPRDLAPQIPWRMQLSGVGGRVCAVA